MSPRYSYQHPLHAHPLQELQAEEVEAAEAVEAVEVEEAEADKQTNPPYLTSDSAETLPRYSQEKERKQTASSPNSNATI